MRVVFDQIILIILVTALGFIAAKIGIITAAIKLGLSKIVLVLAVPAAIVASGSLDITAEAWVRVGQLFVISFIFHVGLFFLSKAIGLRLYRVKDKGRIAVLAITFGNVMFVGFPVVKGIYGAEGLFLAAIFVIPFNLLFYTLGIKLVNQTQKMSMKQLLLTPFNVSLVVMFILLITQFKLPTALQQTADLLGGLCTPLSLLVVGAMVADCPVRALFEDGALWVVSIVRTLMIPVLILGIMALLPLDLLLKQTVVALAAMPGASMSAMVAEQYQCAPRFGSLSVVHSTVLFVLTFPFMMYLSHLVLGG